MLYWFFKLILLGPLMRLLFRPKIIGKRNIPKHKAAVIASNHLSFTDSLFLPIASPRRITFLAKSEYFTGKGPKGLLSRWFFQGVGQIPIDRSGGRASEAAVASALRVLSEGNLLGIYPEGTRSPDGRLYRGRTGMARIAIEAGVPVIPTGLVGTFEVQPPGQRFPKLSKVKIIFGEPIDLSEFKDRVRDPIALREATNRVMSAIEQLSGQQYVDVYASRVKEIQAMPEPDAAAAVEAADGESEENPEA